MRPIFMAGLPEAELKLGIDAHLARDGFFVLMIQDRQSHRCRGYTIGLSRQGHAELTLLGGELAEVHKVLGYLGHDILHHGREFHSAQRAWWYGEILNFEEVQDTATYAPEAFSRYGAETRLLEVQFHEQYGDGHMEAHDVA